MTGIKEKTDSYHSPQFAANAGLHRVMWRSLSPTISSRRIYVQHRNKAKKMWRVDGPRASSCHGFA